MENQLRLQEMSRLQWMNESHWSRLYRFNTKLNKSLVKMDIFSHSSNDLVGNSTLPNLPFSGKRQEMTRLSGEIHSVFYLCDFFPQNNFSSFFPWPPQRCCYYEHQLSVQIDSTNSKRVTHRWNFPPWPDSELVCSSTVWALMDAVKSLDEDEGRKKKTWQSPNFPSELFFFNVLTC